MPGSAHLEVRFHAIRPGLASWGDLRITRHRGHTRHGHTGAELRVSDIDGLSLQVPKLDDEFILPLLQFTRAVQEND